jgi:hypothetical protein
MAGILNRDRRRWSGGFAAYIGFYVNKGVLVGAAQNLFAHCYGLPLVWTILGYFLFR